MILLSVIGFSGTASATSMAQKQILTEDVQRIRVAKTTASFNRLRTELISVYFLAAQALQTTHLFAIQMKSSVNTAFRHASRIWNSAVTQVEEINFQFQPRNFDDPFPLRA